LQLVIIEQNNCTMSQGFDRYSESVGHLVMTEDGAVTNVIWFHAIIAQSIGYVLMLSMH